MSPRTKARVTGALFLATLLMGAFAQGFVADRLVEYGNATLTASNILANEPLYRLAYAVYLIEMACQIAMTVLFYDLLKPVSRSLSLLAAILGITGCTIKLVSRLYFASPLLVLGGAKYLSVFNAEQLHAQALLFLHVNHQAETIAMVFFGFYALGKGYLVFRSTFLPRLLGVASVISGLGWLTYLYEPLAARLLPFTLAVGLLVSLAYIAWLLAFGVNEQRWLAEASASRASIWR
ncbi:MAG: DUF4386 domain-containing protein [Acidobacteria bacterium]|nr:DUF4386 domain-containing protein [Acidobacteriota bacterium]